MYPNIINKKIIIGTAQWGLNYGLTQTDSKISSNELKKIVNFLEKKKIYDLDTSIIYGDAHSRIAQFCNADFRVYTKFSVNLDIPNEEEFRAKVQQDCTNSLSSLGQASRAGIYIHNTEAIYDKKFKVLVDTMHEIKMRQKNLKVGISVYTTKDIETLLEYWNPDIIQLPINVIDQRLVKSGSLKLLKSRGVEVHARSIFLQGLLLRDLDNIPPFFQPWISIFKDFEKWCLESNMSKLQACVSDIRNIPEIDKIVIGVDNSLQLEEISNIQPHIDFNRFEFKMLPNEDLLDPRRWIRKL